MKLISLIALLFALSSFSMPSFAIDSTYWIKIPAKTKEQRTLIANHGLSIETVASDYVVVLGTPNDLNRAKVVAQQLGVETVSFAIDAKSFDFPSNDSEFHTLEQLTKAIQDLAAKYPNIVRLQSIGKSLEGRDITSIEISTDPGTAQASAKPGVVFLGTHHAREHISTETPLKLAQYLCEKFAAGDAEVTDLVKTRQIFIVPLVNPDGAVYDVEGGAYHMWRKNRRHNADGTYGVDLNRNYDARWGQGGSSEDGDSEVYMGPTPFSEPETQAVRDFLLARHNVTTLLSYHTFSKLVLYPWGGSYDEVPNLRDRNAFSKMANDMARMNGYTPEKSSDLYIATGDTCDWAYEKLHIFAFTFELDPSSIMEGGFYPGQSYIQPVFEKNLKPALYLIKLANDPTQVVDPHSNYGLQTPLLN